MLSADHATSPLAPRSGITKAGATPGLRWALYTLHRWVLGLVYRYMTKLNPEFAMKSTADLDHFGHGKTLDETAKGTCPTM
jgi:hypothetical protein